MIHEVTIGRIDREAKARAALSDIRDGQRTEVNDREAMWVLIEMLSLPENADIAADIKFVRHDPDCDVVYSLDEMRATYEFGIEFRHAEQPWKE